MRRPFAALISLCFVLVAAPAAAQWSSVAPGVDVQQRIDPGPRRVTALRVDLCESGVRVRATASGERGQTTSAWGSATGVVAAINGGFFQWSGYGPDAGVAAGNGAEWPDSADSGVRGFVGFGHRQIEHSPAGDVTALWGWADEAVNGDATLVSGGTAVNCGGCGGGRHPRTAVGWTADRRTLFLVVVDGRSSSSIGMSIDELAVLMAGFGVDRAMNLDGGGSSTLWTQAAGVLNVPSDGSQRVVGNHLGVFASGFGSAWSCPDVDWQASVIGMGGGIGATTTATPGEVVTGWIDVENTGNQTWPAGWVKLGTTGPRDRVSALAGPTWAANNRMAVVGADVPPGAAARFDVSFTAPGTEGSWTEEFGVLHEWVSWFGDDGGPADGAISFRIDVVAGDDDDATAGDDDAGAGDDDAGDDAADDDATAGDDDAGGDAGDDDAGDDDEAAGNDDEAAGDDDAGDDDATAGDDVAGDDDAGDDDAGDDDGDDDAGDDEDGDDDAGDEDSGLGDDRAPSDGPGLMAIGGRRVLSNPGNGCSQVPASPPGLAALLLLALSRRRGRPRAA